MAKSSTVPISGSDVAFSPLVRATGLSYGVALTCGLSGTLPSTKLRAATVDILDRSLIGHSVAIGHRKARPQSRAVLSRRPKDRKTAERASEGPRRQTFSRYDLNLAVRHECADVSITSLVAKRII